jgi:hypothetical protein
MFEICRSKSSLTPSGMLLSRYDANGWSRSSCEDLAGRIGLCVAPFSRLPLSPTLRGS